MIEIVGTCQDQWGDEVTVYLDGFSVLVDFCGEVARDDDDTRGTVTMSFDAETRDQFIRLWAEAGRRAEANAEVPGE